MTDFDKIQNEMGDIENSINMYCLHPEKSSPFDEDGFIFDSLYDLKIFLQATKDFEDYYFTKVVYMPHSIEYSEKVEDIL